MQSHFDDIWGILGGVCGALIPLALQTGLTPRQLCVDAAIGIAGVLFVAPWLAEYLNLTSPKAFAAISFGVGLVGLKVAEWILNNVNTLLSTWSNRRGDHQ